MLLSSVSTATTVGAGVGGVVITAESLRLLTEVIKMAARASRT